MLKYNMTLALAMVALVGHCNAQASKEAADMRAYLVNRPSFTMRYRVSTELLKEKLIEFTCQQDKYTYKWIDPQTGSIVKMFTYDGHHCYILYSGGHLEISASPISRVSVANSWFSNNPIYNPFLLIFSENRKVLNVEELTNVESTEKMSNIGKRMGNTFVDNANGGVSKYVFDNACPFPTAIELGSPDGMKAEWKVTDLYQLVGPENKTYPIPKRINFTLSDSAGRSYNNNYSVVLDESSVKILPSVLGDEAFRVPLSMVKSATDIDTGVVLKSADMVPK